MAPRQPQVQLQAEVRGQVFFLWKLLSKVFKLAKNSTKNKELGYYLHYS